jgi:hypothetical protein
MTIPFDRSYLLLQYGNPISSRYAFEIRLDQYDGGRATNPLDLSRNPAGDLLIVRGVTKREFTGRIFLDYDPTGTVSFGGQSYTIGAPDDLYDCLKATTLQALSFEDDAFWEAQWVSVWQPAVDHDPKGATRTMPLQLVEK